MSHSDYITEIVHDGRDNTVDLQLTEDGTAIDHSAITRVVIAFDTALSDLDSAQTPALFDFTDPAKLTLKLGSASLPEGRHRATLVIYDPQNTNGIVWEPKLELLVHG